MSGGGSHIPWGDPDGPAAGEAKARTPWLRFSQISPILLRSAGIAGIAAGIMVVVSNGIWTSEPRITETRAPTTEIALRDVTEEPVVAPPAEAEGGALLIDSGAAPAATEPAPERFAATPAAATPDAEAAEPAAPVAMPEAEVLAALSPAAEAPPAAEDAATLATDAEPVSTIPESDPGQEQAAGARSHEEAIARARLALAAAAAENEPQAAEAEAPIPAPLPVATEAAAIAPDPVAVVPERVAATLELAPAPGETAAAEPVVPESGAAQPDAAALARARQAVALAAAAESELQAELPQAAPQQEPVSADPVTPAGESPFTEHAVECPRDWVASDQSAEVPPGCQTIAALIPSDIEAEEQEALIAAAEERAELMPRIPQARPDPGPNPIRETRTRTARANSSWPDADPPNCGSKHARWRFVDEARTQKEWYCR